MIIVLCTTFITVSPKARATGWPLILHVPHDHNELPPREEEEPAKGMAFDVLWTIFRSIVSVIALTINVRKSGLQCIAGSTYAVSNYGFV